MLSLATATAAPAEPAGGGTGTLLLFALPLLLLVYLFWSQRNRQRKVTSMQAELQIGDEVMTSTGLYGTIVDMSDRVVTLEAAPGVALRWDRRAIVRSPLAEAPVQEPTEQSGPDTSLEAPDSDIDPLDPNRPRDGQ